MSPPGIYERTKKPLADRFWPKVDKLGPMVSLQLGPCWLWTGAQDGHGYGQIWSGERSPIKTYRVAYELTLGPIPEGLQLDHLCRTRLCVNPAHLEAVTSAENTRRGNLHKLARSKAMNKTHCKKGHYLDATTTYIYDGYRKCRVCANERMWRYRERQRERT